jgi:hypothetical protein
MGCTLFLIILHTNEMNRLKKILLLLLLYEGMNLRPRLNVTALWFSVAEKRNLSAMLSKIFNFTFSPECL